MIQSSLRTELKNDVTVITVAHRLQTIMDYDKIVSSLLRYKNPSLKTGYRWCLMLVTLSSTTRPRLCYKRKEVSFAHWSTRAPTRKRCMRWRRDSSTHDQMSLRLFRFLNLWAILSFSAALD